MAVAQHDIERAGDRVAAAVGRSRTHDLDALDQLRRNAIDEERTVEAGAGHALAVDEDLRVAGIEAAQAHAVVFQHVGQEGHAGHALEHVANGQRLELLEVFKIVDQRRWRFGAVAVDGFAADHDRVECIGAAVGRGGAVRGLRNGERRDGHEEEPGDGQGERRFSHGRMRWTGGQAASLRSACESAVTRALQAQDRRFDRRCDTRADRRHHALAAISSASSSRPAAVTSAPAPGPWMTSGCWR